MDVSDISKVASRKRLNTDAEQLREKVSRETAKIIKLKVAQDTAYWDLKEKLQQVTRNHERLQQNMVEVQMQHETVSAQYQQELRLRPDTLNKLNGTRKICDVLEDYGERLRRTLARCRDDQTALADAYAQCGQRVRVLAQSAQDAKIAAETEARHRTTVAEKLGEARAKAETELTSRREIAAKLERREAELATLQVERAQCTAEVQRLLREQDGQRVEFERARGEHQRQLQEVRDETRVIECQAREMASRASSTNGELQEAKVMLRDQATRLKETGFVIEELKKELSFLGNEKRSLENTIANRDKDIQELETEIKSLKETIFTLEAEKLEILGKTMNLQEESNSKTITIQEMTSSINELEKKMADIELSLKSEREQTAIHVAKLTESDAAHERELDAKASAIAGLMANLKVETDARTRAEATLSSTRRQAEAERDAACARDTANAESIRRLEATIAAKDDEMRGQMSIIVEMRSEKDRLQDKIRGMQNTIDNIQKELTGRLAMPMSEPPEKDAPKIKRPPVPNDLDDSLYNFMSDNSVDGEVLDPREVGRRFASIARNATAGAMQHAPAPISLSQVKHDLKMKSRAFFKNKRLDNKNKKLK